MDPKDDREGTVIDNAEQLTVVSKTLSPSNAAVNRFVLFLLESLSREYFFSLMKTDALGPETKPLSVKLSMSAREGVVINECSDPSFETVLKGECDPFAVAVSASEAAKLDLTKQVRVQTAPSDHNKMEARKQLGNKECCFFDPFAYELFHEKVIETVRIELDARRYLMSGPGMGLTTAPMRYPHLLKHLFERFKEKGPSNICIMGPGLLEEKGARPMCPQVAELFALFPEAKFLIVDKDDHLLETLVTQYQIQQTAVYDPTMLRLYSANSSANTQRAPEKYQPLMSEMKKAMGGRARNRDAKKMMLGIGPIKPLLLKLESKKIELRRLDFLTDQFKEEEKFDSIVATMSLVRVYEEVKGKPAPFFALLGRCLSALKEGGVLYMDFFIVSRSIGKEKMKLVIDYLERAVGNRLKVEEIPLSDFLPEAQGDQSNIVSITLENSKLLERGFPTVSTSSLTAFTRTAEKIKGEKLSEDQLRDSLIPTGIAEVE